MAIICIEFTISKAIRYIMCVQNVCKISLNWEQ